MTETSSETLARPSESSDAIGLLTRTDAVANLAVRDIAAARRFYEDTLGFKPVHEEGGELVVYRSGKTDFFVYQSDFAGTNQATALTWSVGERIEQLAEALAAKGVKFEHYEMPGMRREGDVHVADGMKIAWFKDPDGNILSIASD